MQSSKRILQTTCLPMWRQLPVARGLRFSPAARLRPPCFPKRFCFFSASPRPSAPRPPQQACSNDDDFFVDIDSLAGFTEPPEGRQTSATPAPHQSSENGVLGVVREIPEEGGARFSRLHIPLPAEGAGGSGQHQQRLRSHTRAGLAFGEEARYADASLGLGVTTPDEEPSGAAPAAGTDEEGANAVVDGRMPDPAHLPYDDQRFAEMVLEMEVNGVIDETWQDAKRAHAEDVREMADILTSLKVRDICCIDVSEKTSAFDYMLFGTCEGARHIHLAAWAAQDADKVHRISKVPRKQTDELWEVVPIGRIVLNLMVESFREEMTLERKWAVTRAMDPMAAANAPVSEGRQVKAHGLWTLTLNLQDLEDFEVDYCKDILIRQM